MIALSSMSKLAHDHKNRSLKSTTHERTVRVVLVAMVAARARAATAEHGLLLTLRERERVYRASIK